MLLRVFLQHDLNPITPFGSFSVHFMDKMLHLFLVGHIHFPLGLKTAKFNIYFFDEKLVFGKNSTSAKG